MDEAFKHSNFEKADAAPDITVEKTAKQLKEDINSTSQQLLVYVKEWKDKEKAAEEIDKLTALLNDARKPENIELSDLIKETNKTLSDVEKWLKK